MLPLAGTFLLFQQQGSKLPVQHAMLVQLDVESRPSPVLRHCFAVK